MKTNGVTNFSDGTICDYCSNTIYTKVIPVLKEDGNEFCCIECAWDFKQLKECQHYKLKNEGNEGCGRCVKCGEEVRIY